MPAPGDILETRAELRDLADAVRDLAMAQERGAGAREAQRAEGHDRGEAVLAGVKSHHEATTAMLLELTRRVDYLNSRVEDSVKAKAGAPWWLVSVLVLAVIIQGGVVLSLYAQKNGQDSTQAFKDGAMLVPGLPKSTPGLPGPSGDTP